MVQQQPKKSTSTVFHRTKCVRMFSFGFFFWLFQFTAKFFLVVVSIILKMETISARGLFTCQSWCVSSSRWCRLCVFQSLGRVTHFIRTDVAFGRLIKCTKIDFVGRDMKQRAHLFRPVECAEHLFTYPYHGWLDRTSCLWFLLDHTWCDTSQWQISWTHGIHLDARRLKLN